MMIFALLCGLAFALFCITRGAEAIRRDDPRAPLWLAAGAVSALPAIVHNPSAGSLALLAGSCSVLFYCFSAIEEEEEEQEATPAAVQARTNRRPARRPRRQRRGKAVARTARGR